MPTPTKVIITESSQMHVDLIRKAFNGIRHRFKVVAYEWSTSKILEALARYRPQVAVISCDLEDGPMTGIQILPRIGKSFPEIRTILLLSSPDKSLIVDAFRFGAVGVFTKDSPFGHLRKAVEVVSQGQIWANSAQLHYVLNAFTKSPQHRKIELSIGSQVTQREAAVAQLAVEGLSNREIGQELMLTEHTVKNYLSRVFDKLGVSNRVELVLYCLRQDDVDRQPPTTAGAVPQAWSKQLTTTG